VIDVRLNEKRFIKKLTDMNWSRLADILAHLLVDIATSGVTDVAIWNMFFILSYTFVSSKSVTKSSLRGIFAFEAMLV